MQNVPWRKSFAFFEHCEAITKLLCCKMAGNLIFINFKHFRCNTAKLFHRNTNVHAICKTFPPWNILHLKYCPRSHKSTTRYSLFGNLSRTKTYPGIFNISLSISIAHQLTYISRFSVCHLHYNNVH